MVTVASAPSPVIAQMLKSLLEESGIPAYVQGGALLDEFAKSQEAFGASGVDVQVANDRLEEAKLLLAEAREAGRQLEEEEEASEDADDVGPDERP
jgi:hypothetical protein